MVHIANLPSSVVWYRNRQEKNMKDLFDSDLSSNAVARLIMAGARSVALATQVIAFIEDFKREQPEVGPYLETLCRNVIKDWGLDMAMTPPAPAMVTPVSSPKEDEDELLWPPPPPKLPTGYGDCYYHVREACIGAVRDSRDEHVNLTPDMALVFANACEWNNADQCWQLRLGIPRAGEPIVLRYSLGQLRTFWLRSRDIKPGDEIPKEPRP